MQSVRAKTRILERLVRHWWARAFGETAPHIDTHAGRPGPVDPRATTLLVWSSSPNPALLTLLDVEAGPATHGFDRAWALTNALPGLWASSIRIVPADGPSVRTWASRHQHALAAQASQTCGRIRFTCDDTWLHGLPPVKPVGGERIHLGVDAPDTWDAPALRVIRDGMIDVVVQHDDGVRVSGTLRPTAESTSWTPTRWDDNREFERVWFEALCISVHNGVPQLQIANATTSYRGRAEWVYRSGHVGIRWVPAPGESTDKAHPADATGERGPRLQPTGFMAEDRRNWPMTHSDSDVTIDTVAPDRTHTQTRNDEEDPDGDMTTVQLQRS